LAASQRHACCRSPPIYRPVRHTIRVSPAARPKAGVRSIDHRHAVSSP
jgi:hypothetical protein